MSGETQQIDSVVRVRTPENISFQYEVVGPFRRFFAYVLDLLVSLGGFGAIVALFWLLSIFIFIPLAQSIGMLWALEALFAAVTTMTLIGWFVVYWFYGAYCETNFNGRTIGKWAVGMRVISADGHAIDGVQGTLRNLFRLVDLMPLVPLSVLFEISDTPPTFGPPTCLFGLIVMSMNRRFQRLGDLVANTMVVNEERKLVPDLEMFEDPRVARLAELIPASFFVSPSLARTVADYIDHRRRLNFQRASEIASYLAKPLLERFGLQADTDHDLFLCALYYRVFLQRAPDADQMPEFSSPHQLHWQPATASSGSSPAASTESQSVFPTEVS